MQLATPIEPARMGPPPAPPLRATLVTPSASLRCARPSINRGTVGCSSHCCYPMHDITPKVPAIAVRMAMIILSICFQSISFMFVLSLMFLV